jgi:uncharacterized protein YbjT (DUF2867 family)
MILVIGATGNIGGEALRLLLAGGASVRALSRDPSRLAGKAPGAEVVRGDLMEPDTLVPALAGVEKVLLVAGADHLAAATENLIRARSATLRHVVLISSSTILVEPPTILGRWHLAAEEHLKASGLAWTMLRPGYFASNALRWAASLRADGAVYAPVGGSSAPIDPRDIAAVAVRALTTPGHEGKTYVLTGEQVVTPAEQVAQLGAAVGKTFRLVEVPDAGARAGMLKSGMPEIFCDAILEMAQAGRAEREPLVTGDVRAVTGAAPRSFADWVRDHVAAFR